MRARVCVCVCVYVCACVRVCVCVLGLLLVRVMAYRRVLVSDYCVVVSIECFVGLSWLCMRLGLY